PRCAWWGCTGRCSTSHRSNDGAAGAAIVRRGRYAREVGGTFSSRGAACRPLTRPHGGDTFCARRSDPTAHRAGQAPTQTERRPARDLSRTDRGERSPHGGRLSTILVHSGTLVCMDRAHTVVRGDLLVRD